MTNLIKNIFPIVKKMVPIAKKMMPIAKDGNFLPKAAGSIEKKMTNLPKKMVPIAKELKFLRKKMRSIAKKLKFFARPESLIQTRANENMWFHFSTRQDILNIVLAK